MLGTAGRDNCACVAQAYSTDAATCWQLLVKAEIPLASNLAHEIYQLIVNSQNWPLNGWLMTSSPQEASAWFIQLGLSQHNAPKFFDDTKWKTISIGFPPLPSLVEKYMAGVFPTFLSLYFKSTALG